MAKKVPMERMAATLTKILDEYGQNVNRDLKEINQRIAKEGAKTLRQDSSAKFGGGRYSKGWTTTFEENRYSFTSVIHNKTPGLPHLLEKPHAKRGGGYTAGNPHIAPVEEKIGDAYERAVRNDL